ncbi:hypothetical protein F7725_003025 [Dissostichus mawsoni]|uniref:UNC93-like protein MFSD11 n=1 Tax=Dissostichus mawsoni TaxID=36200 RepID=A0A7J5YBK6_DISMA|nr:hypothetical protein F7725_003025 [Dissostichus mawsoni]
MADRRTFNVVILGLGFLFIFTAFTTCGNVESWNHLWSLFVRQFTCTNSCCCNWTKIGYIAVFIIPSTWSFYLTSVLIGIGAAMLWTAQGHFLVENSEASTINRNTGVFWALLQCSMLFGNLYIYFDWNGKTEISDSSRKNIFVSLLVTSVLGTLSFLVLRKSHHAEELLSEEEGQSLLSPRMMYKQRANSAVEDAKLEFRTMLQLLKTKTILLLSPCMAYSGLELSFYSGVYGTCIGATAQFGESAKGLIGISGIVVGIGEIVGGGLFGLLCKNNRFRRTSVVVSIALLCSFLLGLGDSCFNTQLYSILGCVYAEQSAPAFAIFKFIQSVFAAVAFFYSGYILLKWQLLLMVILGFTGTLCFFVVERVQNLSVDLPEY